MRRILVDAAQARGASKRGWAAERVPLDDELFAPSRRDRDTVALDDVLDALTKKDARKARVAQAWLAKEINPAS